MPGDIRVGTLARGLPTEVRVDALLRDLWRHSECRRTAVTRDRLYRLIATFRILRAWDAPRDIQLAGALHTAYASEPPASPLFRLDERNVVRAAVGGHAEKLVYLLCATRPSALVDAARRMAKHELVEVEDQFTGLNVVAQRGELAELLVVHVASTVPQMLKRDGRPAPWLSAVTQVCAMVRELEGWEPPWLRVSEVVTRELEDHVLGLYEGVLSSAQADAAGLERALQRIPVPPEIATCLGVAARLRGQHDRARDCGRRALEIYEAGAAPWDGRLSHRRWRWVAATLAATGTLPSIDCDDAATMTVRAALQMSEPQANDREPDGSARFARYVAHLGGDAGDQRFEHYPGLLSRPWHNASGLPLARDLEAAAAQIASEFARIGAQDFSAERESIDRTGSWDVCMLYDRGRRHDDHCAKLPTAAAIVERHRTARNFAGMVYLSRLAPRSRVAPHCGPTNLRLRCHLGVIVPQACGIRVGGEARTWELGRCLLFDDSYFHEVWNDSESERVVLIVDVWHPDLTDHEVQLITNLHRYVEQKAHALHRHWSATEAS